MGACRHFLFADIPPSDLSGKIKQAFSNGFLGTESFGFSTLVSVVNTRDDDVETLTDRSRRIRGTAGCAEPGGGAERPPREEIGFMAELCLPHEAGTLLTISRELGENGITESFRSLPKADSCAEQKIWTVIEDDMPVDAGYSHRAWRGERHDTGFLADFRMASSGS